MHTAGDELPSKPTPPAFAHKSMSFAGHIARGSALVYDLRVTLDGEARYFIVKANPAKRAAFLNAVEKDSGFRLEDFGQILHRGWGEPGEALKALLREEYGMYVG